MSRQEMVRSGVPQMMVLGPLMFLLFINYIGHNTSSTLCWFADNALIYRYMNSKEDSNILQKGLDQLYEWKKK